MGKLDDLKARMGNKIGESMGATRQPAGGAGGGTSRQAPAAAPHDWRDDAGRSANSKVIELSRIVADPGQPRKEFDETSIEELAANIKEFGLLQAIVVRPGPKPGEFTLISGERRTRAARLAGWQTIRAEVMEDKAADEIFLMQLIENLMRADLKPVEQAKAFREVMDAEGSKFPTASKLAAKLGVSEGSISKSLALLELPESVQVRIVKKATDGKGTTGDTITPTLGYEIARAPAEVREALAERVIAERLTVAETAQIVGEMKEAARAEAEAETVEAASPSADQIATAPSPKSATAEQGGEALPSAKHKPVARPLSRVFESGDGLTITARRKKGIQLAKLAAALEAALSEVRAELTATDRTGDTSVAAA